MAQRSTLSGVVLVFIDGLGIGGRDPARNPVHAGVCPTLARLVDEACSPIDAGLGVPGLPQSATGQTALLTGRNAAQLVGRHVEGFPNEPLRQIIREHNIFVQLSAAGLTSTFANAYFVDSTEDVTRSRLQSVTTVAALSGTVGLRTRPHLAANDAVYQDLTRDGLRARGYTGPRVSPAEAAGHLAAVARAHDFTLFEYFQTDRAGHRADPAPARAVLALLDAFLAALVSRMRGGGGVLVLTSDHGNIEDVSVTTHTANPVPFVALGEGAGELRGRVGSILDVTPAILELLVSRAPQTRAGR
jgi:hypothetical protein